MLFETGMDLEELRSVREEIMSHSQAYNTVKGYRSSWRMFVQWCESAGRQSLPASEDTVSLFAAWATKKRKPEPYALTHVKHICSAIQDRHRGAALPNPITDLVRETLAGIARSTDQDSEAKDALTPAQLKAAVAALGDGPVGIRDRAILLVGFTSGWRSCELAGLNLQDVRFGEACMTFHLRRSKTDQLGKGRKVKIPRLPQNSLCPVAALEAWILVRGRLAGPLFQPFRGSRQTPEDRAICSELVCDVVQRTLRKAGIDPDRYGAHSLRSGMVTAATENGADLIAIIERTGQKRLETVARYVRSPGGFNRDPLAGVL
jgi:site-specific recombinase XerD